MAVDLRRADAHAAGIERGVRTPVDDHAVVRRHLGEVAVRPCAGESLEVGAAVLGPVAVVPEPDRRAGEGLHAYQFALALGHCRTVAVEYLHRHAKPLALQFAGMHGPPRTAQGEAGDQVRAAGDRRQRHVALDVPIDVLEPVAAERRAGGKHRAQRRQIVAEGRLHASLVDGREVLGAHPEHADAFLLGEVEQRPRRGLEGRAVVQHDAAAAGEASDQPVPHHPAAGGEEEQHVLALEIDVQPMFLEVLQQRAASPVADALRLAGGARGIEDVERMVEGQRLEAPWGVRMAGESRRNRILFFAEHRNPQQVFDAGDGIAHRPRSLPHVEPLAAVAVAVAGDQHLGLNLPEAIQRALDAEIRRAGGPNRADAGRGEHRHHRLRHVRQPPSDAISPFNAERNQRLAERHRFGQQLPIGERAPFAAFEHRDQRHPVVREAQQVLGEVQPRLGKPTAARKPLAIDERHLARFANDPAEIPDRPPEQLPISHRPPMQRRIIRRCKAKRLRKARQIGLGNALGAGLPEGGLVRQRGACGR